MVGLSRLTIFVAKAWNYEMDTLGRYKQSLQVPIDRDSFYVNDRLTNRDLIPTPEDRRTWTALSYTSYWIVEGVSISGYTTVSSLIGFGLSVKQSIGCATGAGVIYGVMAVVMGWIGSHQHIGFPVLSRMVWGIRGGYFPIIIRVFTCFIWASVQSYWGGQAVRVCISAMSPSYNTWNTFPESASLTSADFVGMVLYVVIMVPCLRIAPERLQWLFRVSFCFVFMSIIGMLIWSMRENNGPGSLFSQSSPSLHSRGDLAWAVIQGIFSIVGTAGTGILGQSDWCRYARHKNPPVISQIIGAPLAVTFAGTMGALITSASNDLFGSPVWNPLDFLSALQTYENNSSRARAGVFFAGAGFVLQQISINLLLNYVSSGMDLSGMWPKYLNIRRASYVMLAFGFLAFPWKIVNSARAMVVFGSGWGCFCSALSGVTIAKYYLIYKRRIIIEHLYINNPSSVYWFYKGVDWRVAIGWILGTGFLLPGLAADANNKNWIFWSWIFKLSYLWGLLISLVSTLAICYCFPWVGEPVDDVIDTKYSDDGVILEETSATSKSTEIIVMKY